jgi:regulatory protein
MEREQERALAAILRYLARRDHSERELRRKLNERFSPEAIDASLREAQERGWLPAAEVLSERVADQLRRKGKSHAYINRYLQGKGLPPQPLNRAAEQDSATRLLLKRYPNFHELGFAERAKALRWLRSRGFSVYDFDPN